MPKTDVRANAAILGDLIRDFNRHLAAGLLTLGDKGYHGAGEPAITPYKGRNKPESQKAANRAHAKLRPGPPFCDPPPASASVVPGLRWRGRLWTGDATQLLHEAA